MGHLRDAADALGLASTALARLPGDCWGMRAEVLARQREVLRAWLDELRTENPVPERDG
jgi:hypothetical protein